MSEAFKWNLTPTERRVAEAAYASAPMREWQGGATPHSYYAAAVAAWKVLTLRGEYREMPRNEVDAMLAELRSEPETIRDIGIGVLVAERDRLRALLERFVAHREPLADIQDAARAELAR